jgi:hypothetical protein
VGDYVGIAWLSESEVALARTVPPRVGGTRVGVELVRGDLGTGELRAISVPLRDDCTSERYFRPKRGPDGTVYFLKLCLLGANGEDRDDAAVMVIDLTSNDLQTYMHLGPLKHHGNVAYTIDSPAQRVLYTVGGALCSGIAVATQAEARGRLEIAVGTEPQAFSLDSPADLLARCPNEGRAADPAQEPHGTRLAFAASPQSVGLDDRLARLNARWNLYVADDTSDTARVLVTDLDRASGIEWSPQSALVSFSGRIDGGQPGLWVVHPDGGEPTLVSPGEYSFVSWSPDGKHMAALRPVADAPLGSFASDVVVMSVNE